MEMKYMVRVRGAESGYLLEDGNLGSFCRRRLATRFDDRVSAMAALRRARRNFPSMPNLVLVRTRSAVQRGPC